MNARSLFAGAYSVGTAFYVLTSSVFAQPYPIGSQPESPGIGGMNGSNSLSVPFPAIEEHGTFIPLFRLNQPFYNNVFAVPEPQTPFRLDSAVSASETPAQPVQGLLPLRPATPIWNFNLAAGIAQSYDSNIQQTSIDRISDTFTTLSLAANMQAGTPDSIYLSGYDTILALKAHYELSGDIFASHSQFNALNQRLQLDGRIGRSAAIWRPFVTADDVTGSNLLTVERAGRVERQHLDTGVHADYRLTTNITWSQTFSHLFFNHPANDQYVNFSVWRSHQELSYRTFHDLDLFIWNEYSYTLPDEGSNGEEIMNGLGWRGRPDPRLFSELLVGWDQQHLDGNIPGRRDQSGVRISGYTQFDWSSRLRLTLKYDRGYTFNELTPNDNYVGNSLQFVPEIFLGGNWYVTPYFGISYDEFESTYQKSLEIRPELEVAYALPNDSRIFAKIGYDHFTTLNGPSLPVDIYRCSIGFNYKF